MYRKYYTQQEINKGSLEETCEGCSTSPKGGTLREVDFINRVLARSRHNFRLEFRIHLENHKIQKKKDIYFYQVRSGLPKRRLEREQRRRVTRILVHVLFPHHWFDQKERSGWSRTDRRSVEDRTELFPGLCS